VIGDTWWALNERQPWPPQFDPGLFGEVSSPYKVPGIIVLTSSSEAIFRADVDGSELRLSLLPAPLRPEGCL
jgi:hypothetical protein